MDGFAVSTTTMSLLALLFLFFLSPPVRSLWHVSIRFKSVSVFTGEQARMGTCQIASNREICLFKKNPYTLTNTMGLNSEVDLTFTFPTTRRPIAILTATSAILTAHLADTACTAPSPKHSWQELTGSHQTK